MLPVGTSLLLLCCCYTVSASIVELSYTYLLDAPTSPSLKALELQVLKKGHNKYGIWVELNNFCSSEHSGTHIDAPVHFSKDGWAVDEIPLERLHRRPGIMVDVSEQASEYSQFNNYKVQVRHLERWVSAHGPIPDGAVVIIHTGWGRKFASNITAYSGYDQETKKLNFPGISIELARWLGNYGHENGQSMGIVGVGIDTISLDVGTSVKYESHVLILGKNIYCFENMANTHMLPPIGFTVTTLPLKIRGGSGGPVRIIAEIDETYGYHIAGADARHVNWSMAAAMVVFVLLR